MTDKEKLLLIYNKVKKLKQTKPYDKSNTQEKIVMIQDINTLIKEYVKSTKKELALISLNDDSNKLATKLQIMEAMIADSVVRS